MQNNDSPDCRFNCNIWNRQDNAGTLKLGTEPI